MYSLITRIDLWKPLLGKMAGLPFSVTDLRVQCSVPDDHVYPYTATCEMFTLHTAYWAT